VYLTSFARMSDKKNKQKSYNKRKEEDDFHQPQTSERKSHREPDYYGRETSKMPSETEDKWYKQWKREQEILKAERIARQRTEGGEWKREWDAGKESRVDQDREPTSHYDIRESFRRPSRRRKPKSRSYEHEHEDRNGSRGRARYRDDMWNPGEHTATRDRLRSPTSTSSSGPARRKSPEAVTVWPERFADKPFEGARIGGDHLEDNYRRRMQWEYYQHQMWLRMCDPLTNPYARRPPCYYDVPPKEPYICQNQYLPCGDEYNLKNCADLRCSELPDVNENTNRTHDPNAMTSASEPELIVENKSSNQEESEDSHFLNILGHQMKRMDRPAKMMLKNVITKFVLDNNNAEQKCERQMGSNSSRRNCREEK